MCWFAPNLPRHCSTPPCAFSFFSGNLEGHRVTHLWKAFHLRSALELEAISLVLSLIHAGLQHPSHWPFILSLGLAAMVNEGQREIHCTKAHFLGLYESATSLLENGAILRGASLPTWPPKPSTNVSVSGWLIVAMKLQARGLDIWHCHYLCDPGKFLNLSGSQ